MTYRSLASIIRNPIRVEKAYMSLSNAYRSIYEKRVEKDAGDQIVVGGYTTKNFEQCPDAQKLYSNLPVEVDRNRAETTARFLDQLFGLEKGVIATEKASADDVKAAKTYADRAKDQARMLGLEKEHDFIDAHVQEIEKYHKPAEGPKENVTSDDIKKAFARPPVDPTKETKDSDIDNQKFRISRNIKAQRKLKIIDND
jgi:hypothetical protein